MYRFILLLTTLSCMSFSHADVKEGEAESTGMHEIFETHWQREMKQNPVRASLLGDRRFNGEWRDLSKQARQRRHEGDKQALADLQAIDREILGKEDRLNYDLFERQYRVAVDEFQFKMELIPISQRGGIQTLDEIGARIRMQKISDYEDWLTRLGKLDTLMEQTISLMQEGIREGIVPPKATMKRVPAQIEKQLVDNPEQSLFYKPFANMPENIASKQQDRLRQSARETIQQTVIPAYQRLYDFFTETYLPACREDVGVSALPHGKEFYEFAVRKFTTTDLTPDEVHELGLQEVARNREEMKAVMEEVEFEGDLQDFFEHLRTDPQFYYDTPKDLFDAYLAVSKRIDPKLVDLFGNLPRMPYGLKKIPDAIAPDTTTAYYTRPAADGSRPGYYWVNLHKPETRPKYEMEVLSVHEAVPGHHLQIALQQELEGLPNFRRYGGPTAFIEGWGLYSERLGYEIDMYQDPYSQFGQLTYDMWRAVRLVVDTGMHYKGWSRQEAIDYFKDNAAKTELDIINEIDRYISWPGQALAYKAGQLKILALRDKAEKTLGDDFDVREFHDVVLGNGAVPLSVLDKLVTEWIES